MRWWLLVVTPSEAIAVVILFGLVIYALFQYARQRARELMCRHPTYYRRNFVCKCKDCGKILNELETTTRRQVR